MWTAVSTLIRRSSRCRCGPTRWRTDVFAVQSVRLRTSDSCGARDCVDWHAPYFVDCISGHTLGMSPPLIPHGEEALLRRLEPSGDSAPPILRDAAKTPLLRMRVDSQET